MTLLFEVTLTVNDAGEHMPVQLTTLVQLGGPDDPDALDQAFLDLHEQAGHDAFASVRVFLNNAAHVHVDNVTLRESVKGATP